jgi:hypothetical protein
MAKCECLEGCIFFNDKMKERPAMGQLYKKEFCLGGDNAHCARYMVRTALGRDRVPVDLYPNQIDRAAQLIAAT